MRRLARSGVSAALVVAAFALPASATYSTDRMELQARIVTQQSFHHDGVRNLDWVQERNEFRFDLKYDLIPAGQPFLGLTRARINMLYRGRYDGVFDIRARYRQLGYARNDFRFPEGKTPREFFLDLEFRGFLRHLGARIGRQQVVWGEADLFRSLDVVNPLRLDQNELLGDDFADYRTPLWIAKFLYDIGSFGPFLENTGLEFFYSPNSRPITDRIVIGEAFRIGIDQNNPVDGFRRRNSLPFQQVRYPWEVTRIGPRKTDAQDFAEMGPLLGNSDFIYLIDDDFPKKVLSFEGSAAGVRFLGRIFGSIDFSLNYVFKRAEIPGTALHGRSLFDPAIAQNGFPNPRLDLLAQAAVAAASPDFDGNGISDGSDALIRRCIHQKEPLFVLASIHGSGNPLSGCLSTKFWYPWTHIVGATLTYNDNDFTGAVFRMEQSVSTKEPRNGVPPLAGPRAGNFPTTRDFETNGMRDSMVWRSMVGFDYLRALGIRAARSWPQPFRSLLGQDQWLLSLQFFDEYYSHARNQIGLLDSVTDRQQQFNPLFTFVATGFFVQQRLRPWISLGYDVNGKFPFAWLQAEYNIGKSWTVRAGDVIWMGSKNAETFLPFNKYADRDNLFVRITYYLL